MFESRIIPLVWGFAEGTLFFIVPDVWLTILACRVDAKKLWTAIGWAVTGALLGGVCMYLFGFYHPGDTSFWMKFMPGVNMQMTTIAYAQLFLYGLWGMALGMIQGIPYKIYAAQWGIDGGSLPLFIGASILFRLARFAAVGFLAMFLSNFLDVKARIKVVCVLWVIFYYFYFHHVGWW